MLYIALLGELVAKDYLLLESQRKPGPYADLCLMGIQKFGPMFLLKIPSLVTPFQFFDFTPEVGICDFFLFKPLHGAKV